MPDNLPFRKIAEVPPREEGPFPFRERNMLCATGTKWKQVPILVGALQLY